MFGSKDVQSYGGDAKQQLSLERLLEVMCSYGKPTVHRMSGGWWVTCEMHVSSKGTTFKIESESKHTSPTTAAKECLDRIEQTLAHYRE